MSNRLLNIFKRKASLSRENISSYGSSNDNSFRHLIEEQAMSNEFSQDALDGWDDLNYDMKVMKNLDAKFGKGGLSMISKIGIVTVGVAIISIAIYFASTKSSAPKQSELKANNLKAEQHEESVVYEQEEIIIPDEIEAMVVQAPERIIKTELIQQEFKQIQQSEEKNNIKIEMPPLPPLNFVQPVEREIITNRLDGIEIYLNDLKLIDYRKYREKPTVKTKQLELSGTPANLEGTTYVEEEAVWKETDIPYHEYIDKSTRIFHNGGYKKALSRFETILATYPDDINALFYAGLCYFNFGEYDKSIDAFNRCLSNKYNNFDQEAYWYLAKSFVENGQPTEAKKILKKIIETKGYYQNQAQDLLHKL